jgi:hypothetical protein
MAPRAAGVRPEAGKPQRLGEQALLEHSTRVKAVAAQVPPPPRPYHSPYASP